MALGVEANPNMNARMAQHILVRTNRIIDANDSTRVGGWVTNAAGRSFNRNYGFGLIDATAFVEMAEQSMGVTEQTEYGRPVARAGVSRDIRKAEEVSITNLPEILIFMSPLKDRAPIACDSPWESERTVA